MAPEKVTKMVLDVDLKCSDCYKKVKKIICKIPQIRDQEFDVDKNKVKITVICCSPEKIRDKLCYKGGRSIQGIEILADKPKPKDADKSKPTDKPKDADKAKPVDKPKDLGKSKEPEKPKGEEKPKPPTGDAPKKSDPSPKPEAAKMVFEPVQGYPQMYPTTYSMVGYGQYHEGYGGGQFQAGYGMPVVAPQPSGYDYGYGGNTSYYRSGDYFSEENPQGCCVM